MSPVSSTAPWPRYSRQGRFGDRKVFIASLWARMIPIEAQTGSTLTEGATIEHFTAWLLRSRLLTYDGTEHGARLIVLCRADPGATQLRARCVRYPRSGEPREVALSDEARHDLAAHRHTRGERVFCDAEGRPFTQG
jgi:hypothetical protein